MRVAMVSLGCDKNAVDADVMLGLLHDAGYTVTDDVDSAEIIIVNTCGFIGPAKEESIDRILEASLLKTHGKCQVLVVAGCLAQRYMDELFRELPEVDAFIGPGDVDNIVDIVSEALSGKRFHRFSEPVLSTRMMKRYQFRENLHSVFVKIAEGCSNRCSYCIIPQLRGKYQSRPLDEIVREVKAFAARGVKEINLVAQDTSCYGIDLYGRPNLAGLLQELLKISGPRWFRLLYCYPTHITDELVDLIASERRIARYLDIPLQHADPRVLRAMRRPGPSLVNIEWIKSLRRKIPNLTLRTTMIVGFPGEDEEAFANLMEFVQEAEFDHLGCFKYSREENTPAASLPGQVPEEIKERRYRMLMETQQAISLRRNQRFLGRIIPIMLEKRIEDDSGGAMWIGRGEKDAPDVDGVCYVAGVRDGQPGEIVNVRIDTAMEYDLRGEMVLDQSSQ